MLTWYALAPHQNLCKPIPRHGKSLFLNEAFQQNLNYLMSKMQDFFLFLLIMVYFNKLYLCFKLYLMP